MKIYQVGGAVRDRLLGWPVQDRDWVVVGGHVENMLALGFKEVGRDFPVFLHPQTHEEYALARAERKVAKGYRGFYIDSSASITLEEDLSRRDLTINAMAWDEEARRLIDPFGGQEDLRKGILRHVTGTFVEDPLRVLRVARFAARFNFSIAPETMLLMRHISESGEVDALVPERVWQECCRALMEKYPGKMFEVLKECRAWPHLFPPCDTEALHIDVWTNRQLDLAQRCALWCTVSHRPEDWLTRVRAPKELRKFVEVWLSVKDAWLEHDSPEKLLDCLTISDAWRRSQRFQRLLWLWDSLPAFSLQHETAQLLREGFSMLEDIPWEQLLQHEREKNPKMDVPSWVQHHRIHVLSGLYNEDRG